MRTEYTPTAKFDTHSVIKTLIKAGVKELQAEAIVTAINSRQDRDAATKLDLMEVENRLSIEIEKVKTDIEKVRTDVEKVRTDVERSRVDFIKWQITTIITLAATMIACFKYFLH